MPMRLPDKRPPKAGTPSLKAFTPDPRQQADEALRRKVSERLLDLASKIFLRLEVVAEDGDVTLKGTVASAYERNVVLRCVRQIEGVQAVHDLMREQRLGAEPSQVLRIDWRVGLTVVVVVVMAAVVLQRRPQLEAAKRPVVKVLTEVRVDGKPAAGAFLTLHPLHAGDDATYRPQGRVGPQGAVEWTTYERGDGVPPGEYAVTAVWSREVTAGSERRPGANVLRHEYSQPDSSRVRMLVRPEPTSVHLDLQFAETSQPVRR